MVVVGSKRDQRVRDWLVGQVGHEGAIEACANLAGARPTNPSNVSKVLGLVPLQRLAVAAKVDASAHLEGLARVLGMRSCT